MNTSQISAAASGLQQQVTGDTVGLAVLKKAMNAQAQGALQLINSVPQPSQKPVGSLGNNVNTYA